MGLFISNRWSSKLMETIDDLLIVGLERSAKFSHRNLTSDRFIIGPMHKSLTAEQLKFILTELKLPGPYLTDALEWFGKTNQIGLGFEQCNGVSTYRLYLEFFDRYTPDLVKSKGLLHLGYKWNCENPESVRVTRYSFAPFFNDNNPEQVVRKVLSNTNEKFTADVISAIWKSLADVSPDQWIMTCAEEDRGCRNSFDVNVYRGHKKLNLIKEELENISRYFRIDEMVMGKFIEESGDAALGHISCGRDAINNPFFTVYFDDFTSYIKQHGKSEV